MSVPAGLKAADIGQFASRAAQLEKFKPVISYWCEYHIVRRILDKGLHTNDDACMNYTTNLMDKLEKIKAERPDNDAILDDVVAKAYVEQFAVETFQRAENAMRNDKSTAQTADTFRASATFLELLSIWSQLEPEFESKIKYAKYHALRIARALKAGENPNLSNPKPDPAQEVFPPPLDPNDPEVQTITAATPAKHPTGSGGLPSAQPASPTDARPAANPHPRVSPLGLPATLPAATDHEISPLESSPQNDRADSVGGGYFPEVPTFTSETSAPSLPTAPPEDVEMKSPGARIDPNSFYNIASSAAGVDGSSVPSVPTQPMVVPAPVPAPVLSNAPVAGLAYRTDEDAVLLAQKHARWAISALNFEDVNTAVKELQTALLALGAG